MRTWQAADAQQDFERLVEAAKDGPQMLMMHAEPVCVLMSADAYDRLKKQADAGFADFLVATPLEEADFSKNVGMSL